MEQLHSGNTESSSSGTHGAPDTGPVLLLLYPELRAAPDPGALWRVRAHTAALLGAHTAEQIIQ